MKNKKPFASTENKNKKFKLTRKIRNPYRHKISSLATHHLAQILDQSDAQALAQLNRHPPPPRFRSVGCAVDVAVAVPKSVVKAAVGVAVSPTEKTEVFPPPKTKEPTRGVDVRAVTDGEGRKVLPYQRRKSEYVERTRVGEIIAS